jgi:hypothetical protein
MSSEAIEKTNAEARWEDLIDLTQGKEVPRRLWHSKRCAYPGCNAKAVFNSDFPSAEWGGWSQMAVHPCNPELLPEGFYCPHHTERVHRVEEDPCCHCGVEPVEVIWPGEDGEENVGVCLKCDEADDETRAAREAKSEILALGPV